MAFLKAATGVALTAVLCFLALPPNDVVIASAFALVPMFLVMQSQAARRWEPLWLFLLGWLHGAFASAFVCWWLWSSLTAFTSSSLQVAILFVVFACAQGGVFGVTGAVFALVRKCRAPPWLAFPIAIVLSELVTPQVFPYSIAAMVHSIPSLNQIADVGGRLSIVALLALVNVLVAEMLLSIRAPRKFRSLLAPLIATVVASILTLGYSLLRRHTLEQELGGGHADEVLMINPAVSSEEKRREPNYVLERYVQTTQTALSGSTPTLVVWGETALARPQSVQAVQRWLRRSVILRSADTFIFGAVVERDSENSRKQLFNAAIGAEGGSQVCPSCFYAKQNLVPFGESRVFGRFGRDGAAFTPGGDAKPMVLGHGKVAAVSICYELLDPELVRTLITKDAGLLVSVSSDLWFKSVAPSAFQLAAAKLRSIEHRRFLVRSAAGGLSAIIDPIGLVTVQGSDPIVRGRVQWRSGTTLYDRWGDWPVLGLCGLLLIACLLRGQERVAKERCTNL